MKIVVTGATGFVGRKLVPLLAGSGAELLLVGREPDRITALFPSHPACGYDEIAVRATGFDMLVHLAVVNSGSNLPPDVFRAVNVELLLETAESARLAGVPRFVNLSSVHALDPGKRGAYAQTKREAAERLSGIEGIEVVTVFLPSVHADGWSGRLGVLNALPLRLARVVFQMARALKPTVHVARLAEFVLAGGGVDEPEIVLSDGQDGNSVYHALKRMIDLAFALGVAIVFWWGLVLIWAVVRLQSPGPGIFRQDRIGRNGRLFCCYKFRTMKHGTAQVPTHQAPPDAMTGVGRFLRRTKLDELPQIWNLLRNDLSLIGPRPCLPSQAHLIEARKARGVLALKPGLSGLAQINGIDMSDPELLARWDARYLALQSLSLDLRIILATVLGGSGPSASLGRRR